MDVNSDFYATGTKSAVAQAGEFGQRKLYAAESPEVRFFDERLAHLKDGVARVVLDPVFLKTIEGEYLVHVTPYGDATLYIAEIGQDYFVVKAREGDPNVAFAWRLSAHRKGYAGARLEVVTAADDRKNADWTRANLCLSDHPWLWGLNAHRKGYAGVRLEAVRTADRQDQRIGGGCQQMACGESVYRAVLSNQSVVKAQRTSQVNCVVPTQGDQSAGSGLQNPYCHPATRQVAGGCARPNRECLRHLVLSRSL